MIDYGKIHHLDIAPEKLKENPLLTFPLSNVAHTGEMLNRWQVANYKGFQFGIKEENSRLSGSLHKYNFDGKNWQDYHFYEISKNIQELVDLFEFNPEKSYFNFIEFGVNIEIDFDPTQLLKRFLLYKTKPFQILKITGKGFGIFAETQQFIIKLYNKSLQNDLPYYLLRVEIKVKKMEYMKKYGISTLSVADLLYPETYTKLKPALLVIFENILNYDPEIESDKITNPNDRELFLRGMNKEYWTDELTHKQRFEKIRRFKELGKSNQIIEYLKEKVNQKWDILSDAKIYLGNAEKYKSNKIAIFKASKKPDKITTFQNIDLTRNKNKTGQNNLSIKGYSVPRCIITELSLEHQNPDTKYLSPRSIRWYFENNTDVYYSKLYPMLTEEWKLKNRNANQKAYFNEIYHQIRNRGSNPRNTVKRSIRNIEARGLTLFPVKETIDPMKLALIL